MVEHPPVVWQQKYIQPNRKKSEREAITPVNAFNYLHCMTITAIESDSFSQDLQQVSTIHCKPSP